MAINPAVVKLLERTTVGKQVVAAEKKSVSSSSKSSSPTVPVKPTDPSKPTYPSSPTMGPAAPLPGETKEQYTTRITPPTYTKSQVQGQVARDWAINLKTYVQQRAITTAAKNRIIPSEQYVMQEEGPSWSKGQILTGAQIQSQYANIQDINRTSFMENQKNQMNLINTMSEFHPSTKVKVISDANTGGKIYEFSFQYPGAEHYKSYKKMVDENRNVYLAGRFVTSPTLNVDYTLAKTSQEKTDIMVKWLHGVRGSPEGGYDTGRMLSTIGSSPFVNVSLMAGGSAIYGAGRGLLVRYGIGKNAFSAVKVYNALELGVGAYFGYTAAENIKKTYEQEGAGAAIGTGISTGLILGGAYAGFKAGSSQKFTRGLPKGSTGYTTTEYGAHKGTISYGNKLAKLSVQKYGGKTTYEDVYKSVYKPTDTFNWYQKEYVGTKLRSMSPEQATLFKSFENYRFTAQGMYGDVQTFTGMRGLVGQKDFDVSFGKAETMQGQPKKFTEFAMKQATKTDSQLFGGSTYKAKGAHDVDIMVRNLSQYTRRVEYGAGKSNVKFEEIGMDIKPYVRKGKIITTSGSMKQKPYTVTGKYGDIDVMRWSETTSRLGDASKLPTSRRTKINVETGKLEAKDINSYMNMVSRLHYQAGGKQVKFDMEGFLKTGKEWEQNFVQMGTAEESALFDTKTLPEKWANVKNEIYKRALPEKLQQRFQEKNYQKIMGFDERTVKTREISDVPSSPNISSGGFSASPVSFGFKSPSSRYSSSLISGSSKSNVSSRSSISRLFSGSVLGGYPSISKSKSIVSSSLSPSPYRSPSSVSKSPSSKYSYSPSVSSGYRSMSTSMSKFPMSLSGGGEGGRGYDDWEHYFRKRKFNIGSINQAFGIGMKPMKIRGLKI